MSSRATKQTRATRIRVCELKARGPSGYQMEDWGINTTGRHPIKGLTRIEPARVSVFRSGRRTFSSWVSEARIREAKNPEVYREEADALNLTAAGMAAWRIAAITRRILWTARAKRASRSLT